MSKKRIAAAVVAMLLVQWSAGMLLALTAHTNGSIAQTVVASFAGAFAGGFIAQRGFLVPAAVLWALIWGALLYLSYDIASASGTASVLAVLKNNAAPLILSCVAVSAGALIGQKISSRPRVAAAT
jgi:hypothetical protein